MPVTTIWKRAVTMSFAALLLSLGIAGNASAKNYYFVLSTAAHALDPLVLREHRSWLCELERSSVVLATGPLSEPGSERPSSDGIIVLVARSISDAARIAADDPLHRSGIRTFVVRRWSIKIGTILSSYAGAFASPRNVCDETLKR